MEAIKTLVEHLSTLVEAFAALVIAVAVAEAAVRTALIVLPGRGSHDRHEHHAKEAVRLRLGRWLALSLELLLAADILQTAIAPTWDDIGKLAAVAAIRTALNFFLQREIDGAERRRREDEERAAAR